MTQSGRQGSPRSNSGSGNHSAGRSGNTGGAGRSGGAPQRGSFSKPTQGWNNSRGAAAGAGSSRDENFEAPKARRPKPGVGKPGFAKDGRPKAGTGRGGAGRNTPIHKNASGRGPARSEGAQAFGDERFGRNLGPVKRPQRSRRPQVDAIHPDIHDADGMRLQKIMASAGVASRRVCEEMIEDGRVEVDGQIVTELGLRVDPKTAVIHVDGIRIQLDESMIYMVFNKPKGVVSTMEDPEGRPCVSDFLKNSKSRTERLFHVGRLDVATEGLLLLTNDGELANRLTHPSYEVPKTYLVQVRGPFPQGVGAQLRDGVELEDGFARVDSFKLVDSTPGHVLIEVVLHSGKNRIVRRLFDAVGFPVQRLVRVKVGPIGLGDQRQGSIRVMGKQEVGHLLASVGL
ncbi:pseudouridine synthase [Pseudarthrobacter sp. J1763]|uniref:pseudouridine synthase n=1 Tax=Pseudarthrobacter sp. J1763 TaxID=3420445 RepID=UPI003D2B8218